MRHDSADTYEKLEATLQSIRRYARVQVTPVQQGFWIDVAIFKELEDVKMPAHASAGSATFRYDDSLTRVANPVSDQDVNRGWIRMGRDRVLEQRILLELRERLGLIGIQVVAGGHLSHGPPLRIAGKSLKCHWKTSLIRWASSWS